MKKIISSSFNKSFCLPSISTVCGGEQLIYDSSRDPGSALLFDVVEEEEEAILILETTLTSGDLSTAQLQHVGQIHFFSQQEALCFCLCHVCLSTYI